MSNDHLTRTAFTCVYIALAGIALGVLDARTAPLASNTMLLCLSVAGCTLPISFVLAVLLFLTNTPGRHFLQALFGMLLFFPLYLQASGWNAGFGPLGWQTKSLDSALLAGWPAAVWVHTIAAIPWATLIIGQGMRSTQYMEGALLEAGPFNVVRHVILPSAAAPLLTAALWIIVQVAAEMTVADLFLIRTYAEELYTGFALGESLLSSLRMLLPSLLGLLGISLAVGRLVHQQAAYLQAASSVQTEPVLRQPQLDWTAVHLGGSLSWLWPAHRQFGVAGRRA